MRRRPAVLALAALAASLCLLGASGCGDDDEEEPEAQTEAQTATEATEEATETATVAETTELTTFTEADALRETTDAVREFNREVNLGRIDEACEEFFSERLLAAAESAGGCAEAIEIVRGRGRVELNVQDGSVLDGVPMVSTLVGGPVPANTRRFQFVYEDATWKIEAVLDTFLDPILGTPAESETPTEAVISEEEDAPEPVFSEKEATAEIVSTLTAFNRTANAGRVQEACTGYFSEAFLARLPTERQCATTLARARAGRGKVRMEIDKDTAHFDEDEGRARITVHVGPSEMIRDYLRGLRRIDLVFEDGEWKIDAVNTR